MDGRGRQAGFLLPQQEGKSPCTDPTSLIVAGNRPAVKFEKLTYIRFGQERGL
jgi:hypothetical protein